MYLTQASLRSNSFSIITNLNNFLLKIQYNIFIQFVSYLMYVNTCTPKTSSLRNCN